jgi:hypothetical protein
VTQPISLHTAVRHKTRSQTAVAELLAAGGPRYQAAVELQQAGDRYREATAAGRATDNDRYRLAAAEAVWTALAIGQWQVTA